MNSSRVENITDLINEIRQFPLNYNSYIDDSGYCDFIDEILKGKIRALRYYLNYLNMNTLQKELEELPLDKGKALVTLEILRNFVIKEIELELDYIHENHLFD